MQKVTITFKLPEESDEYNECVNAGNMRLALEDISQYLRQLDKYGHKFTTIRGAIEKIREEFYIILSDRKMDTEGL